MAKKTYKKLEDLPMTVQSLVRGFRPENDGSWIFEPVPALENESLLDVIKQGAQGEKTVRLYLAKVEGHFLPVT